MTTWTAGTAPVGTSSSEERGSTVAWQIRAIAGWDAGIDRLGFDTTPDFTSEPKTCTVTLTHRIIVRISSPCGSAAQPRQRTASERPVAKDDDATNVRPPSRTEGPAVGTPLGIVAEHPVLVGGEDPVADPIPRNPPYPLHELEARAIGPLQDDDRPSGDAGASEGKEEVARLQGGPHAGAAHDDSERPEGHEGEQGRGKPRPACARGFPGTVVALRLHPRNP